MKLSEADILRLQPEFMRTDEANVALATAVNSIARQAYSKIKTFSVWDQIDSLDDAALDALALELGIDWYKSSADITTKREVIKASDLVHAKLGTPWAVEKLMSDYYGSVVIKEWPSYGGEPGHFKLRTTNPDVTNGKKAEAMTLLEVCKRKSSTLDDVSVCITGDQFLFMGLVAHDFSVETTKLGDVTEILAEAALI